MADERVVIKIDINADTSAIDRVQRKLRALAAEAEAVNARLRTLNGSLDDNADAADRVDASHSKAAKSVGSHGSAHDRFSKKLNRNVQAMNLHEKMVNGLGKAFGTTLKFGLIGAAVEMAAMGIALSTVNGLLGLGQMAMKTYRFAMQGVAQGAAAAVIALSTVAAAQREYNAATVAFSYKSAPQLGKGTSQAMSAMRNLTADTRLGALGMKNLSAAFAAVSKNAEMTGGLQNALVGLGDFAVAAGGDIGKNIAAAGDFLGLLKKEGSLTEDVLSAASKVGPEFQKAIEEAKKKGMTGADQIISALSSGDLAKQAGLEGALGAVNDTLIGQLKSFMTQMTVQFGDLGQHFLPQVKDAFAEISSVLRVAFMRISGALGKFGSDSILDGLVKVLTKVIDLTANLFDKYLPQSKTMFSGFGTFFDKARKMFNDFNAGLRGFSEGAKVITDTFGPPIIAVLKGFQESFGTLSRLAVENRDDFVAFGDSLTNVFTAIQDAFNGFKELVVTNLPGITKLFNVLATVVNFLREAIEGFMTVFKSIGGDAGGAIATLALVGGLIYGKGKLNNYKAGGGSLSGGFANQVDRTIGRGGAGGGRPEKESISSRVNQMTVYATNVTVNQGRGKKGSKLPPGGGGGAPGTPGTPGTTGTTGRGAGPSGPGESTESRPGYKQDQYGNLKKINTYKGMKARMGVRMENGMGDKGRSFLSANGGTMASMAGLAALYGGAGKEAQPFITAGSALGFVNPQLGLGVAGLGTALTAKTTLGGIASGAMGGAAIGSMFGPVGAAAGAGLGAAAGGVSGYVRQSGMSMDPKENNLLQNGLLFFGGGLAAGVTAYNDIQERKAVRSDVKNTFKGRAGGVAEVLGRTGSTATASAAISNIREETSKIEQLSMDFEGKTVKARTDLANEYLAAGKITKEQANIFSQEHMGTYIDAMKKQGEALDEVAKVKFPEYDRKAKLLSEATGTSAKEISDLALKMGVDLTDGTMSLADAMEKLGLATNKTVSEIQASTRTLYAQIVEDVYGAALKESEAREAINQAAEGLAQMGPNFSEDQYNQFMKTASEQALYLFKGDPIAAARFMQQQFGSLGATQFGSGAVFGAPGMAERFQEFGAGTQTAGALETLIKEQAGTTTTNLTSGLVSRGNLTASEDVVNRIQTTLQRGYETLSPETMARVTARLNELGAAGGVRDAEGNLITGEAGAAAVERSISAILTPIFTGTGTNPFGPQSPIDFASQLDANEAAKSAADSMSSAAKEMGESITQLLESQPNWWNNPPSWYYDGTKPNWMNDTTTPRSGQVGDTTSSRLGRTMARHGFLDSQLVGSRTVTSAWRGSGLGSINSDHVTGNAYDLTGQNLGAYGTMVNRMGGFAEFHGSGGGRHLHVVPGQTPIGDTMSPAIQSSSVAVGGATSYSITINAQAGQDANAIAQEVMARIEERDRSRRERQ
jgi:hypothetical protein